MRRYVHTIDAVFALALFFLFAVTLLLVLLTSAGAYRDVEAGNDAAYSESTCISYISAKVRHSNSVGAVYLGELSGIKTLCIAEEYDGVVYVTSIYCYNGTLRELFAEAGLEFTPDAGQELLEIGSLDFEITGGMLHVVCQGSGGGYGDIRLALAGGGAEL